MDNFTGRSIDIRGLLVTRHDTITGTENGAKNEGSI